LRGAPGDLAFHLRLRCDELVRDGEEGKFQTSGYAGLVEDIGQMALHGLFDQGELLGDIAIAATLDDATDDFHLAWSEAIGFSLGHGSLLHQVVKSGDQVDDALSADPVISRENGANGDLEVTGKGVLKDNAAGADVQGLNNLLGGDGGGEEENLDGRCAIHDGAHGLEAWKAWHHDIEEQDVRFKFESLGDCLVAVGSFANHVKAVLFGQHVAYTDADHRMVVRQQDTDESVHFSG